MVSKKVVATAFMFLAFAACAQAPNTPSIVAYPDVATPKATPVVLQRYSWKVYNAADIQKLAADIEKNPGKRLLIFGLPTDGYRKQYRNMIELRRYIKDQSAIIDYLEREVETRSHAPAPAK